MVDTHILLVVDDSEHQRLLTRVLTHERPNVRVTAVCLGVPFTRALNNRKYDCIILDCNAPDRPADELLVALNDYLAHCPVVVISGLKRQDVNVSCTRADSIDFISREAVFITDELWMRVQEAMRHQEQRMRERRGYERRNRYLARLAETDALTGLSNRHYLNRCLRMGRWNSDRRQNLACILIDIDRFKTINDTFGHSTGDEVLKMVASVVREQIKPDDVALRWGGEEILVMRPSQNLSEAWVWAEKLRQCIGSQSIERDGKRIAVTVCIGLAFSDPRLSDAQLFEAADNAMYLAKRRGRNTICTAEMAFISRQIDAIIISTRDIEQRRDELLRHLASQLGPVQWQYVDHHCGQVSTLVERIAQNLHLPAPTIDQVRLAGLLHDLGKCFIPEELLGKQTSLLDIERQVLVSYPAHSAWLARRLGVGVRTCHWIIEGAAHPLISGDRSKLMQSPMSARMLAVADAASAMLSDRPYRPRLSVEQMLRELRAQQDRHFDAKIVDVMHRIAPSVHGIAA